MALNGGNGDSCWLMWLLTCLVFLMVLLKKKIEKYFVTIMYLKKTRRPKIKLPMTLFVESLNTPNKEPSVI